MIDKIKRAWRENGAFFDAGQTFFNGNFWQVFQKKFQNILSGRILDLGCGTGALACYINPKSYTGIDKNSYYLAHARQIVRRKDCIFLKGDVTDSLPPGPFDVACTVSLFHHLSDQQIEKLCKNLRTRKISHLLIVECEAKKPLTYPLEFLDAKFGGGDYFRTPKELKNLIRPYFQIKEEGVLKAQWSFYTYPYLIAEY